MRLAIACVVLVLVTAACAAEDGSLDDVAEGATSVPTADGEWQLVSGVEVPEGWPITLTIEGDRAGGRAACNGYSGALQIEGSRFSIGEIGSTAMACRPDVMEAESAYLSLLGGIESWHLAGERLQLAGPEGELAFAPVPPVETSALIGVDWVLETVIEGDTAASAVAGRRATLRLETDGTLSGSTGCRDLTGRYTVVGGTVVFNEFAAHGECDAALERQDNQVVTVLGDGFRPEIESDRLTVTATDNEALVYRANS